MSPDQKHGLYLLLFMLIEYRLGIKPTRLGASVLEISKNILVGSYVVSAFIIVTLLAFLYNKSRQLIKRGDS